MVMLDNKVIKIQESGRGNGYAENIKIFNEILRSDNKAKKDIGV